MVGHLIINTYPLHISHCNLNYQLTLQVFDMLNFIYIYQHKIRKYLLYYCTFILYTLQQFMNDISIAKLFKQLCNIQILYLFISIVHTQTYLQASITRSVSLPIQTINQVPYLNLQQLCYSEIKQQSVGSPQSEWPNKDNSEFQQIANYYEESDVMVLLDTGSKQFWLADSSCSQCTYTKNFCPHLSAADKKNTYVKGFIEGIDSYINLCSNRIKFMCVKSMQGFGQFFGHGILGLKQGATGFNMLFNILKKRPAKIHKKNDLQVSINSNKNEQMTTFYKQIYEIRFMFGSFKSYFYLYSCKSIYNESKKNKSSLQQYESGLGVKTSGDWSFYMEQISILKQKVNFDSHNNQIKVRAYVDSGSSKIVLPVLFCQNIIKIFEQKFGLYCRYIQDKGIDCNRLLHSLDFTIKIKQSQIERSRNSSTMNNILKIDDSHLIDPITNRIHILCQQGQVNQMQVLLGHPFLRSVDTTFCVETTKQLHSTQQNEYVTHSSIKFGTTKIDQNTHQVKNMKLMIVSYVIFVLLCGAATIYILDFFRDKRSTKIII